MITSTAQRHLPSMVSPSDHTPSLTTTPRTESTASRPALEPDGSTDLIKFIDWGYNNFPPTANERPPTHSALSGFTREYRNATQAAHLPSFEEGYHNGKPEEIHGYQPGMSVSELLALWINCSSHAQTGTLSRLITQRIVQSAPKREWAENEAGPQRSPAATSALTTDLRQKQDLKALGHALDEIATRLGSAATSGEISLALNTTTMVLQHAPLGDRNMTLATFIRSLGLPLPTDHFSLTGLAHAVTHRALEHPLGDLSGALSWPTPFSADEQTRLGTLAQRHTHHLGTKPSVTQTPGGMLEFLRYQLPLWSDTLNTPAKLLDALIDSPQAHMMGKALREGMQGIATANSDADYLLAAITLQLDPESATDPHRNKVAGFDLASPSHFGQPASVIVERLGQHLIRAGKASAQTAAAAAHLLLMGRAPVFLIKDIPASVTYGSPAWLNLAVAAATIEAQTPGKAGNMSFTQVMQEARSSAVADPEVTANAQKAALLDWGLANGVVATKEDSLYSAEDLTTLVDAYKARTALMASATQALDTDLPSRREMALAELKKRFPGKDALFEEKVITVTTRHDTYTEGGEGSGYGKLVTGLHSMLDVAMMDLNHPDLVFFSADSRIPLAELNANNTFGVIDRFNQQLAEGIENKKTAVATTIKHLIAQLPLEDRKNFEYGDLSFFQTLPYELGTGFIDKTRRQAKSQLLVSIKRDGVTTAYEINFDKGTIAPVQNWQAAVSENTVGNVVYKTEAFAGADGADFGERTNSGSVPDSFVSQRTQAIADTFVKHLDLDRADIKAQARGLTTEDRRLNIVDGVGDFLLNLIPFRSAIVNFQKGQYGEGTYDLALDVFGFLTAGVGTLGKAVKIGGSTASAVAKAFKVTKVIGAATVNALNPLGGFGDMAAGGIALLGKGAKFVSAKAIKAVNTLRGATGSYDLLKTVSKEHGPTLIGTFKMGDVTTEGAAVLKNDRWYKYDHVANKLYGSPIDDFTPRGTLNGSAEFESQQLVKNLLGARTPENYTAYTRGYKTGSLDALPGYQAGMGSEQLRALAAASNRSPAEMGTLHRELRNAYIEDAKYTTALLTHDVAGPGVKITQSSQIYYNAQVDIPSIGECAGMSYAMAMAIHAGKEEQFLKNMLKAADAPGTPSASKFINDLRKLQARVQTPSTYHYGVQPATVSYQNIIDKLANFETSTTVRIGTHDHAMLAGVRVESGKKEWFFYDPNSGLVKFNNAMSMREGMEKVLNSGAIAATSNTLRSPTGTRHYTVSKFDPSDVNRPGIDATAVENLSDIEL